MATVKTLSGEIKEIKVGQAVCGEGFTEITLRWDDLVCYPWRDSIKWVEEVLFVRVCPVRNTESQDK